MSACTSACKESPTPSGSPKHKSQLNKPQTGQPETRTPKKNKIPFNKPLTPPNTPIDCDATMFEKTDKKHKKRSYVHNRNDKVSNLLNILVAGTIATAAGLALGHLMGTKSECANLSVGMNNDLSYKQLQYENYKLKSELQDLKRASWHLNSRIHNKHIPKSRRNSTGNEFSFKASENLADTKLQFIVDFNNNDITNNDVFIGPKTYAESINSSSHKLDILSESAVNETEIPNESEVVTESFKPDPEVFAFSGISNLALNGSDTNDTITSLSKTESNLNENYDTMDSDKQKNSKTNSKVDINNNSTNKSANKVNTKYDKTDNGKFRKRVNLKDHHRSKKGRSVSTGKQSGDYENSVLSLDNKRDEKSQEQNDVEHDQQLDTKISQKNISQERKNKEKLYLKNDSTENQNKSDKKSKNPKKTKYSEDELSQETNASLKENRTQKKNYKKEKRSKMNIGDKTDSMSQSEMKQMKMKKNESKNDRRKSDFKQEKKDKHEDWEMKKGYDYYVSKASSNDQSDDEEGKVKHFPSEKTILTSSDEPIHKKPKNKKAQIKNNSLPKQVESITDGWAFESLCDDECNNVDGSWFTELAKHREEQRNNHKSNNWLFERAKSREEKRDQDGWCFDRIKKKQNNTKRQKKSSNFKSKL